MLITLGGTDLAGGTVREQPFGLSIRQRQEVQPSTGPGKASTRHYARANFETTLSFSMQKLHDSISDAQTHVIKTVLEYPKSGNVSVYDDADATERYIPNAVVIDEEHSHIGCTSLHRWVIVGGRMADA